MKNQCKIFPHVNKFTQKREINCAALSTPPSSTLHPLLQYVLVPPLHLRWKVDISCPTFSILQLYSSQNTFQEVVMQQASSTLLNVLRESVRKGRTIKTQPHIWVHCLPIDISLKAEVCSSCKYASQSQSSGVQKKAMQII